ncbi:MAG TPA: hypothetical protein EYP62_07250, partial [Kiritimatiellae bacterium]|nr:hypothetical protein [Kiritimatiellia bacterium]
MERAWRRHRVLRNGRRDPRLLASRRGKAIVLSHAIVDPVALAAGEELDIPDDLKAPADTEHYIVQFDHRVSARERLQLQQEGIQVSHYVPYSAFAVKVTPGQLERLRNMEGVRAVVPYHPYFKLSREILEYLLGGQDAVALNRVKRGYFRVMLFAEPGAPDGLHQAGFRATEVGAVDSRIIMRVQCSPDRVAELAAVESVGWIEPEIPCRALNDLAVGRVRAGVLRLPDLDFRGDGVIVNVTDTGVDFGHPAFAWDPSQPTSTGVNTRIVYYGVRTNTPTSDGLPGDSDGHGSHVAGTILGNGALSETVFKAPGSGEAPYPADAFAGIAPNALLVMLEDFNSYSPSQQVETAYAHGARISNNSWGNSQYEYSTLSAEFDALVRDADPATPGNQAYIMFFAAGNDGAGNRDGTGGQAGTVGSPGNAKNVITVGALEQPRRADNLADAFEETDSDWELAWFSSRGPVTPTDERVKPDIVAPGSYVLSVQSHDTRPDDLRDEPLPQRDYRYGNVDSGTNYAFFSGTSMATPVAAGAGALIYQYLTNHLGKPPSPALMKAALVAG